jgi:cyclopropane fatty-acyl-phospholipid synthase-like methyltransferase
MDQDKYIQALINLHQGLDRQGPGDLEFSEFIISQLPELPANPRVADIGCGAGAGSLFLAEKFQSKVKAVDFARVFLDQLMERAKQKGLEDLIEPIQKDMDSLGWPPACLDLLWSEGAAYNITFEGAVNYWRPLLVQGGIAIISEMTYFTDNPSKALKEYMANAYPGIKTESENVDVIKAAGFDVLGVHRLPSKAWWKNYYDPLRKNLDALKDTDDEMMQIVIEETEAEMTFFQEHHQEYGYTFFIMQAV